VESWPETHGVNFPHFHAGTYESLEAYLHHSMVTINNTPHSLKIDAYSSNRLKTLLSSCVDCMTDLGYLVSQIPSHVAAKVTSIHEKLVAEHPNEEDYFRTKANKMRALISLMEQRVSDWVSMENDPVQFNEAGDLVEYVSRWPIFVQIFCALIMFLCSWVFHLYMAHS